MLNLDENGGFFSEIGKVIDLYSENSIYYVQIERYRNSIFIYQLKINSGERTTLASNAMKLQKPANSLSLALLFKEYLHFKYSDFKWNFPYN